MKIEYSNGRGEKVASEDEARDIIDAKYPHAEYGDWQESGEAQPRMLVWRNEKESRNDDGSKAVAAIIGK